MDPYQVEVTDPALLDVIGDVAGMVVLDAGCGGGDFAVDEYFGVRTVEQPFSVAGQRSPAASVQQFHSLEAYIGMLTAAGFVVTGLWEPHPSQAQRQQNSWWDDNFVRPLFLLVECGLRG